MKQLLFILTFLYCTVGFTSLFAQGKKGGNNTTTSSTPRNNVESHEVNTPKDLPKGSTTTSTQANPKGSSSTTPKPRSTSATNVPKPRVTIGNQQVEIEQDQHVVQQQNNGQVDWTGQFAEAKGISFINRQKFPNEQQAIEMAKRGAEVVAKANLLETIEGIQIMRETTVKDLMTESDIVTSRVEGIVKGVRIYGEPVITKEAVEVTVRMPLYDKNGLAPVVKRQMDTKNPSLSPNMNPVSINPAIQDSLSQFVLNFTDGQFNPALFPVITDQNGQLLLDLSQYYDPIKGQFPPYIKLGKELLKDLNLNKGVQVLDAIQDFDGSIRINTDAQPKARKWLKWVKEIGSLAIPFIISLIH